MIQHEEMQSAPLIKWAGGKQWLAPLLMTIIQVGKRRQFEPF
ncbi:MAG: hypothetical protein H6Q04_395 [Acidobacteria bacterium]|jgi:site-specific DNA-adenine methylase|nr:hypothetical protein [Acidobacteriota bacterium]